MASKPSTEQRFFDCARKDLDFLVKDFGFAATVKEGPLPSIVFKKEPLAIEIGWYKGEVDCNFNVLLENNVFRPYISRGFVLWEVILRVDPNAFVEKPPLPRWALSVEDADCFLQYYAKLIQKFCSPILRGDLSLLESITWERRKRDKENMP
ncbi:MAG TPA: hypothetical protein VGR14_12910 [Verrucomicrobiae bacterium]|jgi:hypothetical protein|nr:hypothetical protein [Verrucomicrobiae bacterium]